jgi:hypothetical protein
MTTWPSGTKASTANLDAGSDKPRLARPDIKQNVDNVNDIIDYFNVSSASDGDILVYNSSTQKIELGNSNNGFFNITESTKETVNAIVATSGAVDVDASAAPVHTMTLNDDTTFTFTNMTTGTSVALIIKVNANNKTAIFTSDGSTLVKFPNGAPTLTVASGQIDYVIVFFDGVDYIGSIIQGIR